MGNCNSPIFSTFVGYYYSCAKYRAITFSLIVRPLFTCFLHHYSLQILYTTKFHFLIENVLKDEIPPSGFNRSRAIAEIKE